MKKLIAMSAVLLMVGGLQAYGASQNSSGQFGSPTANSSSLSTQSVNDDQIAQDIRKKLAGGAFSSGFKQVTVDVKNGTVTLNGTVKTQEDKDKVEKKAREINGVRNVNNQVTVQEEATNTPKLAYGLGNQRSGSQQFSGQSDQIGSSDQTEGQGQPDQSGPSDQGDQSGQNPQTAQQTTSQSSGQNSAQSSTSGYQH